MFSSVCKWKERWPRLKVECNTRRVRTCKNEEQAMAMADGCVEHNSINTFHVYCWWQNHQRILYRVRNDDNKLYPTTHGNFEVPWGTWPHHWHHSKTRICTYSQRRREAARIRKQSKGWTGGEPCVRRSPLVHTRQYYRLPAVYQFRTNIFYIQNLFLFF